MTNNQNSTLSIQSKINIRDYASRIIPLDELPKWSKWPRRLLQLDEWNIPRRTVEKNDSEYDKDKYLSYLNFAKKNGITNADEIRSHEFGLSTFESTVVSQKGILFELPANQIMPANNSVLLDSLSPYIDEADIVIELGCGYGHNLWVMQNQYPNKRYIGGDYSRNAVELSKLIYAKHSNINVEQFNFYDDTYNMLEKCSFGKKVLVFTRHAIEQLPTATQVFNTLSKYFDRIIAGVHIEVGFDNYDNSLLDLMRKKYVIANDYNRDLISVIKQQPGIEMLRNDSDELGINPLNPSSIVTWRPNIS
ncbi:MAG: class I SAM-dependent methyltransferase [Kiritimatiellales bacterium]|nr:class I SAM-dependent methyltransferase [Kiritimatiellales bacterium]